MRYSLLVLCLFFCCNCRTEKAEKSFDTFITNAEVSYSSLIESGFHRISVDVVRVEKSIGDTTCVFEFYDDLSKPSYQAWQISLERFSNDSLKAFFDRFPLTIINNDLTLSNFENKESVFCVLYNPTNEIFICSLNKKYLTINYHFLIEH